MRPPILFLKVHFDVKGFCCGDIVMFIISIVYNFSLSHHLIQPCKHTAPYDLILCTMQMLYGR